jgi:hypothetical protein
MQTDIYQNVSKRREHGCMDRRQGNCREAKALPLIGRGLDCKLQPVAMQPRPLPTGTDIYSGITLLHAIHGVMQHLHRLKAPTLGHHIHVDYVGKRRELGAASFHPCWPGLNREIQPQNAMIQGCQFNRLNWLIDATAAV